MTGQVFSIEEFSTFNGPGIRMTVFFKGCPLRCVWCHSPEGQRPEPEVVRSPNGCLHCSACLHAGERETGKPCLTTASIALCPRHLVRRCGETYTPETLTAVIRKNAALLNASGGGVTFSGGEPLMQAPFLLACLRELKGVTHRAVQTAGFSPPEAFEAMLPHCDYVLYDLKLMDEEQHRHYTGVSNRPILHNFDTLVRSGVPFAVRIPLIPTVTDTEDNLRSTARLLRQYGIDRAELLPYNPFAGSKYALAGRTYAPPFDEHIPPAERRELFASYGVEVTVL